MDFLLRFILSAPKLYLSKIGEKMTKIPKIIHYCWFGGNPLPSKALKCLDSWKKYLPDYEFVLWDENSFKVDSHPFTKEAYENKKYAFISDYVRLYALFKYGGIYMDTDVEVVKNIDDLLIYSAFSGFENDSEVPTGIMASIKGHLTIKTLLDYYEGRNFITETGELELKPNTQIISELLETDGLKRNGKYQILSNEFHIFPKDFFCPIDYITGLKYFSDNTYTIHHFAGSWLPRHVRIKVKFKFLLIKIFGEKKILKLIKNWKK